MKNRIINAIFFAIAILTFTIILDKTTWTAKWGFPSEPLTWEEIYSNIELRIFIAIIVGMFGSYVIEEGKNVKK